MEEIRPTPFENISASIYRAVGTNPAPTSASSAPLLCMHARKEKKHKTKFALHFIPKRERRRCVIFATILINSVSFFLLFCLLHNQLLQKNCLYSLQVDDMSTIHAFLLFSHPQTAPDDKKQEIQTLSKVHANHIISYFIQISGYVTFGVIK